MFYKIALEYSVNKKQTVIQIVSLKCLVFDK